MGDRPLFGHCAQWSSRSCAWKLAMLDWLYVQQMSQVFGHNRPQTNGQCH